MLFPTVSTYSSQQTKTLSSTQESTLLSDYYSKLGDIASTTTIPFHPHLVILLCAAQENCVLNRVLKCCQPTTNPHIKTIYVSGSSIVDQLKEQNLFFPSYYFDLSNNHCSMNFSKKRRYGKLHGLTASCQRCNVVMTNSGLLKNKKDEVANAAEAKTEEHVGGNVSATDGSSDNDYVVGRGEVLKKEFWIGNPPSDPFKDGLYMDYEDSSSIMLWDPRRRRKFNNKLPRWKKRAYKKVYWQQKGNNNDEDLSWFFRDEE